MGSTVHRKGSRSAIPAATVVRAPTPANHSARRKAVIRGALGARTRHARAINKARHESLRKSSTERGYDRRWRVFRENHLARNPECVYCGGSANVVHHVVPHRGDMRLFWDNTFESCCKTCHDGLTAQGK